MSAYQVRRMSVAEQRDPACHWRCQFCDSITIARYRVETSEAGQKVTFSACKRCAQWFRTHYPATNNHSK